MSAFPVARYLSTPLTDTCLRLSTRPSLAAVPQQEVVLLFLVDTTRTLIVVFSSAFHFHRLNLSLAPNLNLNFNLQPYLLSPDLSHKRVRGCALVLPRRRQHTHRLVVPT